MCFVSETGRNTRPILDPSVRYRCFHPAELLTHDGYDCAVYAAAAFCEHPSFDFDVYIFHRPSAGRPKMQAIVDRLTQLNRVLIADYDDLIFGAADLALESSAVKNATLTPEGAIVAFDNNLKALRWFSRVSASTTPLAAQARQHHPTAQVTVVPNVLPPSIWETHRALGTATRQRSPRALGYFAGTKSHDRDFPVVAEALYRVLRDNPEDHLTVVGPVMLPPPLTSLPTVTCRPAVDFSSLFDLMAQCATVIAPLEWTTFNQCKSRVKFLEAAVAGCHLIATPIPDMAAVGPPHLTLATTSAEWFDALSLRHDWPSNITVQNSDYLSQQTHVAALKALGELA